MKRLPATILAALALSACTATYSGPARRTSQAELAAQPGWVMVDAPEVRQPDPNSCGPTALAIVAGRWGVDPDLAMDSVKRAKKEDASFAELRTAAHELGLEAYVIEADAATLEYEIQQGRPVIVGLMRRYGKKHLRGHYEVIVGVHPEKDLAATIDPAAGYRVRTYKELELEWTPTRRASMVVLGPVASAQVSASARSGRGSRPPSVRNPPSRTAARGLHH